MAESKIPDTAIAQDFVYAGRRLLENNKWATVIFPIEDDGTIEGKLGEKMMFTLKKNLHKVVGGVYTGAKFDGSTVYGLEASNYKNRWHDRDVIIEWQAAETTDETMLAKVKLEADERVRNEIETVMLPLRQLYQKKLDAFDMTACRALELAVTQALKTPVRQREKEK